MLESKYRMSGCTKSRLAEPVNMCARPRGGGQRLRQKGSDGAGRRGASVQGRASCRLSCGLARGQCMWAARSNDSCRMSPVTSTPRCTSRRSTPLPNCSSRTTPTTLRTRQCATSTGQSKWGVSGFVEHVGMMAPGNRAACCLAGPLHTAIRSTPPATAPACPNWLTWHT